MASCNMTVDTPSYRYQPLQSGEFRLLKSSHSDDSGRMHCQLHHCILKDSGDYFALSYQWGDHANSQQMLVDGGYLSVRKNLSDFLKVWDKDQQYLWIDAICIDQSNIEERSEQVRLMASIFGKAIQVITWLGCMDQKHVPLPNPPGAEQFSNRSIASSSFKCEQAFQDVKHLIYVEYWSRMWIVQEVLLANDILVMYNDEKVSWRHFWSLVDEYVAIETLNSVQENVRSCAAYRLRLRRDKGMLEIKNGEYMNMRDLVVTTASSRCSDVKDHVIAILAIVKDGFSFEFSYADRVATIAINAAIHFKGSVELLSCLAHTLKQTYHDLYIEACSRIVSIEPSQHSRDIGHKDRHTILGCLYCTDTIARGSETIRAIKTFLANRQEPYSRYSALKQFHVGFKLDIPGDKQGTMTGQFSIIDSVSTGGPISPEVQLGWCLIIQLIHHSKLFDLKLVRQNDVQGTFTWTTRRGKENARLTLNTTKTGAETIDEQLYQGTNLSKMIIGCMNSRERDFPCDARYSQSMRVKPILDGLFYTNDIPRYNEDGMERPVYPDENSTSSRSSDPPLIISHLQDLDRIDCFDLTEVGVNPWDRDSSQDHLILDF